jgi:histidinol-phosphatase (PHP family)
MFDLHTHHDRCGHARGTLRDYVRAAIDSGLHTIGFSDHTPFFAEDGDAHKPWVAMSRAEFPRYINEAMRLREEYRNQISILIAVESDFFPQHLGAYRAELGRHPFDYVIGSVHVLDGVDLFRADRWDGATPDDLESAKRRYCDMVVQSARCGLFDVLGHVDVIRARCPQMADIAPDATEKMIRAIAQADVVMEVNTSGKTKDCGGWYPAADALAMAAHYRVKVTYGSDAHDPERIGDDHENVRATLPDLGFREWHLFERGRRIRLPL